VDRPTIRTALVLKELGNLGEARSNISGDLGRPFGRVELVRFGPNDPQPFPNGRISQILNEYAKALPVGELSVVLPLA